jgi:dTDP-D-glucose 4,6-dehydratase
MKSISEISTQIATLSGIEKPIIQTLPSRHGHVAKQRADGMAIAKLVGEIKYPFEVGLRMTYEWYTLHKNSWHEAYLQNYSKIIKAMS